MARITTVELKSIRNALLVLSLAVLALAGCGGGGGGGGSSSSASPAPSAPGSISGFFDPTVTSSRFDLISTAYAASLDKVGVRSRAHGLAVGSSVTITGTGIYDHTYVVENCPVPSPDNFCIDNTARGGFLGGGTTTGTWAAPATGAIVGFSSGTAGGGNVRIRSATTPPAVNSFVSISGTTNYNSIYVVTAADATSFTIFALSGFVADDGQGNWQPSSVPPPATFHITAFASGGAGITQVTSVNDLAAGDVVTIGATTNYNGTYSVLSATPTAFTITKTFTSDDATGAWQFQAGLVAGCTTTGSTGSVTLPSMRAVPSRITGVAPLAVFFDASATTAVGFTSRPFHDLHYGWSFGDAASGNWGDQSTGSSGTGLHTSRNAANGPVAAHLFQTPGSYLITLTVTDGTNTVSNSCLQVMVTDPDVVFAGAKTTCISTSGNFTGCPSGATQVTSSDFDASLASSITASKRILYRRGETFLHSTFGNLSQAGPGILGAYGTGAKPIIQAGANSALVGVTQEDWRIMDLDLDGNGLIGVNNRGIAGNGDSDRTTMLRLDIHNLHTGISYTGTFLEVMNNPVLVQPMWDEVAVFDSTVRNMIGGSGGNAIFTVSTRQAFMGNLVDDTTAGEHGFRSHYMGRGVINHNTFSNAADSKHVLTLRGQDFAGTFTLPAGTYSEKIVISDNKLVGSPTTNSPQLMTLNPQNETSDERLRDIIVERNWFLFGARSGLALRIEASEVTVRNNIINTSGGPLSGHIAFEVSHLNDLNTLVPPDQVRIYNNTVYSADTDNSFRMVVVGSSNQTLPPTNVKVRNNLAYAPNDSVHQSVNLINCTGSCATTVSLLNNSSDAQVLIDPLFSATPLNTLAVGNWKPATGSYALGAQGNSAATRFNGVLTDIFGVVQPEPTTMGAVVGP